MKKHRILLVDDDPHIITGVGKELESEGVYVLARGRGTLAEEMPEAYKDVSEVVDVMDRAGISRKVVKLKPLGVAKG